MWAIIIPALTWLGRIGIAAFAVNEIKKLTTDQKNTIAQAGDEAKKAGVADDEIKKLVAATTYDKVEENGQSPDKFWGDLDQKARDALKFSPESLRADMGRTKFLGLAQTLLWVAAGTAASVAGIRGIPILLRTLAKLSTARSTGASALTLMTIIEEGKIAGIARVWIPGLIAGIAAAGGWLTGGLTNNLNDALLWGRIFLDQAHSDIEKAAKQKEFGTGGGATGVAEPTSRTRITISKTSEPKVAVGTIFQSIVKNTEAFKRVVDDQITSADDLKTDVQLNLNKWLATLPGRLHYEIRIVLNPLDEDGNKKLGTWAVLMIGHRNSQGVFQHMQVVPLGPIEPTIYRPTTKEIQTIQVDIPKLLTSEEIINLDLPTTGLRTVDNRGNVTPISFTNGQSPTGGGIVTSAPGAEVTQMLVGEGIGTPPAALPVALSVPILNVSAQDVQMGLAKPYINFNDTEFVYAILTGRKIPYREAVANGWFTNNLVERVDGAQLGKFQTKWFGGTAGIVSETPSQAVQLTQPGQWGTILPGGLFMPTSTPSIVTPPAPIAVPYPYVKFLGSPNVFDRKTGRWIPENEATSLNIFTKGLVQQFNVPRPEVKIGSDYAVWNNRNLTNYPI